MTAILMDGKALSQKVLRKIEQQCKKRAVQRKREVSLAVVLVGEDPASQIYVRNKEQACLKVGIRSVNYRRDSQVSEQELLALIKELNHDKNIDGILVQLPLPSHIDSHKVLEAIDPAKDVDGFHPYNIGRLALRQPNLRPCTPKGVMCLLQEYGIEPKGQHAAIVGQSNIVGRPMALELLQARATITVCHSATWNLPDILKTADIVVAALGRAHFIQATWLKKQAVVVDVGINRLDDGRLVGDVDFSAAIEKVSYITPVPGGVGPMTIACLLDNTLLAANARNE